MSADIFCRVQGGIVVSSVWESSFFFGEEFLCLFLVFGFWFLIFGFWFSVFFVCEWRLSYIWLNSQVGLQNCFLLSESRHFARENTEYKNEVLLFFLQILAHPFRCSYLRKTLRKTLELNRHLQIPFCKWPWWWGREMWQGFCHPKIIYKKCSLQKSLFTRAASFSGTSSSWAKDVLVPRNREQYWKLINCRAFLLFLKKRCQTLLLPRI